MFDTLKDLKQYLETEEIRAVDLRFTDHLGGWHHVTVPARSIDEKFLIDGIGFDGGSVGFGSVKSGDMNIIPDLGSGFLDPFPTVPTLCLLCNIVESDTKESFNADPRGIARKAEEYLREKKIADKSIWGPEFEFYIFDRARFSDSGSHLLVDIYSSETHPVSDGHTVANEGCQIPHQRGYHSIPPMDSLNDWRSELTELLEHVGIPIKYHHHEVGAAGQCEIEIELGPMVVQADRCMIIKYFVRMLARRYGKVATFMPKPLFGHAGSGMHFHQMLRNDDEPLFYDQHGYACLSKVALSYTAGILKHGRSLLAITNPSTNSYKRLIPGFEAPVKLFFSLANRSATVRVPKYAISPDAKRIEFRSPDGTCNPYLTMAAMLMAGIDGIENNLNPEELGFGPFKADMFDESNRDLRNKLKSVPESLSEAMDALEEDHEYLLKGDIFPMELLTALIETKRSEAELIRNIPHPKEYRLYFDC